MRGYLLRLSHHGTPEVHQKTARVVHRFNLARMAEGHDVARWIGPAKKYR
jgi:hypothetical protein